MLRTREDPKKITSEQRTLQLYIGNQPFCSEKKITSPPDSSLINALV